MSVVKKINVEKVLSPILKQNKERVIFYKIAQQWENFVGQSFIDTTFPLKLSKEGILFIAVPNNSVSSQFHYSKEKIISNICSYFGYDVICDLKLIAKPSNNWTIKKSPVQKTTEEKISNKSEKEVDLEKILNKLLVSIREGS